MAFVSIVVLEFPKFVFNLSCEISGSSHYLRKVVCVIRLPVCQDRIQLIQCIRLLLGLQLPCDN